MKSIFAVFLPLILLLICAQNSCQRLELKKSGIRYAYPMGMDTVVLYFDSTYHEINCDIQAFDDAYCRGYESNECKIFLNFSDLPKSLKYSLALARRATLDSIEASSMIDKIRFDKAESIIDAPKSIKLKSGFEGVIVIYQIFDINHLQFRGFGLQQKLLISINIESKSVEVNLENVLFSCLENFFIIRQ